MTHMTLLRSNQMDDVRIERSFALKATEKLLAMVFALVFVWALCFDSHVSIAYSADETGSVVQQDALSQSQEFLLRARHSLMGRDVASAERFVREAAALNVALGDADDRPEYVVALINEYKEALGALQANGMNESARRALATSYLNQAEALRRCRDYDNAEALVREAQGLNATANAVTVRNGMDIESVLQRIQDDRLAAKALSRPAQSGEALTGLSDAAIAQVASVIAQVGAARELLAQGKLEEAETVAHHLLALGIPESAFAGGDSPSRLLGDIAIQRSGAVRPAFCAADAPKSSEGIRQVQGYELTPSASESNGYLYVQEADAALSSGNNEAALTNYRDALRYAAELDAETVKRVNDAIVRLGNPVASAKEVKVGASGIDLNQTPQSLQSEISAFIAKAYQTRKTEPNEALAMLKGLREEINQSSLDPAVKNHFLSSVDLAVSDTNKFVDINGPMISLDNQNKDVEEQLRLQREEEVQIQNRLAEDTARFEELIEDQKYDEAEILAKKCQDYSHGSVVALQMAQRARSVKQFAFNKNLQETKQQGWLNAMNDVETASVINVTDANPMAYGPQWERAKKRKSLANGQQRSDADVEILKKLDMRITLPFDQPMPIGTVLDYIRETMKINVLQDERAFVEVGITSDTPIETKLSDISLKNYLKHVLSPYDLAYVVRDEALLITSKARRGGEPVLQYYYVGDLITPIPDFNQVSSPLSMQSAFDRSYKAVRPGSGASSVSNTLPNVANNVYSGTMLSPNILAQIQATGNAPISAGASGGGADASELIGLITETIDPESWDSLPQPRAFNLTNSLQIVQSEENHAEIRDLLEKLRAMMDLQIAVEVRYVSINDSYYERIGVNFGATIKSDAPSKEDSDGYLTPAGKGVYGITTADPVEGKPFSETLNIDFSQNSYGLAVPQFGAYDPTAGAQLGFAILSDIETYFFISAAEADSRTNVLQSPKVMMFNGQTANVSDETEVPYVYTVIPVVGDFAVAQQPVVTVINEGTFMTVQAVVSPDRQYVRMTVAPYFCTITDSTREFKFEGTDTVVSNSTSATKGSEKESSVTDERESVANTEMVSTGTTIQEPITSSFSVSTTVNVPDGGTVMLGGIKRLSEGRTEAGVPILSKIPYLKRLFSNTSIGRDTTSLMMMVTPRIVIKDEEEEYLTGLTEDDFKEGEGRSLR